MALGMETLLDHSGGPRGNTGSFPGGKQERQNQRGHDNGSRAWSDVGTRDKEGQGRLLPQNLRQKLGPADSLRPSTPSTIREQICVALSQDICSHLSRQQQGTKAMPGQSVLIYGGTWFLLFCFYILFVDETVPASAFLGPGHWSSW